MSFLDKVIYHLKYSRDNAFCIQNRNYSYSDLRQRVEAIKSELDKRPDAKRIGVCIGDNIDTYASLLAVIVSGKAYIPIAPDYPAERIAQIIQQGEVSVILSPTTGAAYDGATVVVTEPLVAPPDADIHTPLVNFNTDFVYVLFTSGSTGVPKGVPLTYTNLNAFTDAFFRLGHKIDCTDRFLQMFDLTFDLSVMSYIIPLCIGACVYTVPDTGMKYANIYTVLHDHQITVALMVPSMLAYLKPYFDEVDLPALKYSLFCGEALYSDLAQEWMKRVPNAIVHNVYGPTEATIFCLAYPLSSTGGISAHNGIAAIGKPMYGSGAIVADDNNMPVPDGEKGELCLSGLQVTLGYLNGNTQAFFDYKGERFYRTGDVAFRDANGDINFCGRIDDQVKIQGYRIELSEIEFHILQVTGRDRAAAFAISTDSGMSRIEAVVEGEQMEQAKVLEQLKDKLPAYMMPSAIHFVPAFPLNANGKTDRKALLKTITDA